MMTLRITQREYERLTGTKRHRTPRPPAPADTREAWSRLEGARLLVWLPVLPPSVNALHVARSAGGKAMSADALMFERYLAAALTPRPLMPAGPYRLTVAVTFGRKGRADADNRVKWTQDCLSRLLNFDDSLVAEVTARAGYAKGAPACELVLEVLE